MSQGRGCRWMVTLRNGLCKAPELPFSKWVAEDRILELLKQWNAAAKKHGLQVRDLSFKATLQHLEAFRHQLLTASAEQLESLVEALLTAMAPHRAGHRPDRYEPRKRKRDHKPYPRLKRPRHEERKLCLLTK